MSIEEENQEEVKITPLQAKRKLEYMGFIEEYWDRVMTRGFSSGNLGSHEVRALITIARGQEPQVLGQIYNQMRIADGQKPVETEGRLRSERKNNLT